MPDALPWWDVLVPWTPVDVLVLVALGFAAVVYVLGLVTLVAAAPKEVVEIYDATTDLPLAARVAIAALAVGLMIVLGLLWPAVYVIERLCRSGDVLWIDRTGP